MKKYYTYQLFLDNHYDIKIDDFEVRHVYVTNINNNYTTLLEVKKKIIKIHNLVKNQSIYSSVNFIFNNEQCEAYIKRVNELIRIVKLREIIGD